MQKDNASTNSKTMQPRSSCALARTLDIIGDRWSILIIRDLMFTNRREYGQLLNAGEGISTNILSERLSRLQQAELINKYPHPNHGKKFVYELTDKGLKLAPMILELAIWSVENQDGAMLPDLITDRLQDDREGLLRQIYSRTPIIVFDE